MSGEQNLALIRQIEEHRAFLLTVLSQNPVLLARAEPRIRQLMEPLPAAGEASGSQKKGARLEFGEALNSNQAPFRFLKPSNP